MPKTPEETRFVRAISMSRIQTSRSLRNEYIATVAAGTLPEDLLEPDFWKHVVKEKGFKSGDDIIARCEDRSWRASYEVRGTGPTHMTLALIQPDSSGVCWFGKIAKLSLKTDTHYVEWINIGHKYAVRRHSDTEIIEKGFQTKELAAAWMSEHCKEIAA